MRDNFKKKVSDNMLHQKYREEYDNKLKGCLDDMKALSDKERKTYIFNAYNDGKISMIMADELTRLHHAQLRLIHG